MKKGEIWLVDFDPALGGEYQKVRPALIIQSEKVSSPLQTVMPISSQLKNQKPHDILVKKETKNRLFSDSIIKTFQIASFDKKRFIHFIGTMDSSTMGKVDDYLRLHFQLT